MSSSATATANKDKLIAKCYDEHLQITGDKIVLTNNDNTNIERKRGKVRDRFFVTTGKNSKNKHVMALLTTDRQSGFDRQLAIVPYKGQVLNQTSQYWFDLTRHIIPNHLLACPHPNTSIVKQCKPFPIEFVVRSYLTGSTSTSIWKHYENGVRTYCGHVLPENMVKNQLLPMGAILTPTTKEEDHDRPISCTDIVKEQWMTQTDLDVCNKAALALFAKGQEIAKEHGLILVDTKYEFGKDCETGEIRLIDEIHTPDSSRYWLSNTYKERFGQGQEPDNIDKEFLRLWFRDHCDPYNTDQPLPEAPRDLVLELSRRYIQLYEMITGQEFDFSSASTSRGDGDGDGDGGEEAIIAKAIQEYLG